MPQFTENLSFLSSTSRFNLYWYVPTSHYPYKVLFLTSSVPTSHWPDQIILLFNRSLFFHFSHKPPPAIRVTTASFINTLFSSWLPKATTEENNIPQTSTQPDIFQETNDLITIPKELEELVAKALMPMDWLSQLVSHETKNPLLSASSIQPAQRTSVHNSPLMPVSWAVKSKTSELCEKERVCKYVLYFKNKVVRHNCSPSSSPTKSLGPCAPLNCIFSKIIFGNKPCFNL